MARCPGCGACSVRGHGRYERRLADAAVGGQRVARRLSVRRSAGSSARPRTVHAGRS
ncbi:transposase family protein [Rugosimonospora africana]|uniref:transposase family protein n=1 Tax=Rugosimonospora africana TaxID=556532 RepID=UPI003570B597